MLIILLNVSNSDRLKALKKFICMYAYHRGTLPEESLTDYYSQFDLQIARAHPSQNF